MRDDWYESHLVIRDDTWRERLGGWFYRIADWLYADWGHEVIVRDPQGEVFFCVAARIPSFNMPPPPFSVWCCEGRIDDGQGHIRGVVR